MLRILIKIVVGTVLYVNNIGAAWAEIYADLMERSGIAESTRQIQLQVSAAAEDLGSRRVQLKGAKKQWWQGEITRSFEPKQMVFAAEAELRRALKPSEVGQILRWHDSTLGRRIAAAEHAAMTPEFPAYPSAPKTQTSSFLSSRRISYLKALDRSAKTTERLLRSNALTRIVSTASGDSASGFGDDTGLRDGGSLQPKVVADHVLAMYRYIYRNLSDRDLERFIQFYQSPIGRKYADASLTAMESAYHVGLLALKENLGNSIAQTTVRMEPSRTSASVRAAPES